MTYTYERMANEVDSWLAAVDAFKRKDGVGVADQFSPPLEDSDSYARTITMGVIGAIMCARELSQMAGHELGHPPPDTAYGLQALTPDAWTNPNKRVAMQAVTVAANGDFHMVADLLLAHIPPHGIEETGVLLELLMIYISLTGGCP